MPEGQDPYWLLILSYSVVVFILDALGDILLFGFLLLRDFLAHVVHVQVLGGLDEFF